MRHGAFDGMHARLQNLAEGQSRAELAQRSARISESYRQYAPSSRLIADSTDVLAYAMARLPATFAAVDTVLDEVRVRAPAFAPISILDVGAGPGTAAWAAAGQWPEASSVTMIDHNPQFVALAGALALDSDMPAIEAAEVLSGELPLRGLAGRGFDLVMASYCLTELADSEIEPALAGLWERCAGALVIVEPGRPRDYQRLMTLRRWLLDAGAKMVAPCPHAGACPLPANDWCHFSVRLARTRDHLRVKNASVPFEDEKFSYLVVARPEIAVTMAEARVVAPPVASKFAIGGRLCTAAGIVDISVAKRDKDAFRRARKLKWGDGLETALAPR